MTIAPKIDMFENDKEYIIKANPQGVKEEDLDISISKDRILMLKGKRETESEDKNNNYHLIERSYGSFERSLLLRENCDKDNVNVSLQNGVLCIKLSTKATAEEDVKKININK
jgi:HSP20 family protein